MFFFVKILISSVVIALASWLAGRKSVLAGFIVTLPLVSMLSVLFFYLEYRDMEKINRFAASILIAVPLSLTSFIPFLLNQWFKMSFALTYISGIGLLAAAYWIHRLVLKASSFR